MKLEFSEQISEKYSDINFMKLHPVGAEFSADGQTDTRDEANSRFSQFCERA
jgi:hypothetical protein